MSGFWSRVRGLAGRLFRTGFFSIFLSNVACKVLMFIGGTIVVRVLSKSDYGAYTYVMNCYGIVMILGDLGCSMAALQFCSESYADTERSDSLFSYGLSRGLAFSGATALALFLSPWYYPFKTQEAAWLTRKLCLMPFLVCAISFLQVNLRRQLENHRYGAINIFQVLIHYVAILPMAYWLGLPGAVYSNYIIYLLTAVFGLLVSKGYLSFHLSWRSPIPRGERRSFLKLALASQLNNGLAQALMLLDVFLIGLIIGSDEVISSYKVATTVPSALAFIPSSVMVYVGPYFARHNQERDWVRQNYARLILACAGGALFITAGAILVAPWAIPLVFGAQYADAVPCFIVLMIGFFFSAGFQIPSQNVIYTQRKVRINVIITVLSGCANCVLDIALILGRGSIGAAWATTVVHMISAALTFGYMRWYLRRTTA